VLYDGEEELEEWKDLGQSGKLHLTMVRHLRKNEEPKEREMERTILGRMGNDMRTRRVAIQKLGEEARGMKEEKVKVQREKRTDDTVVIRVAVDK